MNVTDYVLSKTNRLKLYDEVTPNSGNFKMFNSGGVEVEVGEFLYSLIRIIKPSFVLETGTHLGISSLYMALGCLDNNKGSVWTYEVIPELLERARALWSDLEATHLINGILRSSLEAEISEGFQIDLLFLDSEPYLRGREFQRFWNFVSDGGLIIVHDLDATFGQSSEKFKDRELLYSEFRKVIKPFLKNGLIQVFYFDSPRGLVVFQKASKDFAHLRS